MDEANNHDEHRPRASLKGMGRRILLGKEELGDLLSANRLPPPENAHADGPIDPAALPLTPEETADLLETLAQPFAYPSESPDSGETAAAAPVETLAASMADADSELPSWLVSSDKLADDDVLLAFPLREAAESGVPLAERAGEKPIAPMELPYSIRAEVEALIPGDPETWRGEEDTGAPVAEPETGEVAAAPDRPEAERVMEPVAEQPAETTLPAVEAPKPVAVVTPKVSPAPVDDALAADQSLLALLVDDERIVKLARQIEALEEELVKPGYGDPGAIEAYQQELLHASDLLGTSRGNYDDARAIVYRVRAEMNRQRKVDADIMRYRPLLLNYYIGWGIALGVLFLLKALFVSVTDAVGVTLFGEMYYPLLLGVVGALLAGYVTLERHATRLRDFDPIHISWYLFNPLLGGVMGLLMFLLASIANEDLLHGTATAPEYAITYLLCVVAGMNQNGVLRRLNGLLKRAGREPQ